MSLQQELGLLKPFTDRAHEALLNIVITGTILTKEGEKLLRQSGVTGAQFNVLMLLKNNSLNGEINQTQLGNMLLVNRSNITGIVDRMEKAGFVRRTSDADDRRVNMVKITDAGQEVLMKANKAYYARITEFMSVLSTDEHNILCKLLESIRKQVNLRRENK